MAWVLKGIDQPDKMIVPGERESMVGLTMNYLVGLISNYIECQQDN